MDDDTIMLISVGCAVGIVLALPFTLIASIHGCIAYSRTRKWQKQRSALQSVSMDGTEEPLVGAEGSDDDFEDTEDEAERATRDEEERKDRTLTFGQKFRSEYKKCWSGKTAQALQKEKERKDRRELAKEVAKELERRERRRAKRSARGLNSEAETLPLYTKS